MKISDTTSQLLSTSVQIETLNADSRALQAIIESKIQENSAELRCIKTDLSGFNQVAPFYAFSIPKIQQFLSIFTRSTKTFCM